MMMAIDRLPLSFEHGKHRKLGFADDVEMGVSCRMADPWPAPQGAM
jgi:hypothetical protein